MTNNSNGFAEALNRMNTLLDIDKQVEIKILKKAAEYFVSRLKKQIKLSDKNKQTHLRNSLKVVVKENRVQVIFEDEAWYWSLAEHGHKKVNGKGRTKGLHFVRNTFDGESEKIAQMMAEEIINEMEG